MEDEFQIEGQGEPAVAQPIIKVKLNEGSDGFEVEAPQGVVLHLINEFRARQDTLRGQSMADAERLATLRREMMGSGPHRVMEAH